MEEFFKIFGGTWLYNRDENLKKSMEDMKVPQDHIDFMMKVKPTMRFERREDKIFHGTELMEGVNHDITYELGKEFIAKDEKTDPPLYHNKAIATFDGTRLTFDCESLLTGPGKYDTVTVMYVKDGELISESSPRKGKGEPDTSIVGKRIYKKK